MKWIAIAATCLVLPGPVATAWAGPKSALDEFQVDGVSSDAELKIEGHTRREWVQRHPIQTRDYWKAWGCKGKVCDTQWYANIRVKAALIKRIASNPHVATGPRNLSN